MTTRAEAMVAARRADSLTKRARVLAAIDRRGWSDDVDIIFTTDHGELGGDFGLLFKGPYHVDALMRLPLVWRPARSALLSPAAPAAPTPSALAGPSVVTKPVGLVDLAPTFCAIAGVEAPPWMQGQPLPVTDADADARGFERVLTEWDSAIFGIDVHLRTMMRDHHLCTVYRPGTCHDGTEGELYDLDEDPLQQVNLWDDPARQALRDDLVADLEDHQPPVRSPQLLLEAPA